jgi:hypothetical protein
MDSNATRYFEGQGLALFKGRGGVWKREGIDLGLHKLARRKSIIPHDLHV